MLSSSESVPLSVRIESQMKFVETGFHRLLLLFWHHSKGNWVLKNCFFLFLIFEMYNDAKLWLWNSSKLANAAATFKISLWSGNGFWLVYEDLSIEFEITTWLHGLIMCFVREGSGSLAANPYWFSGWSLTKILSREQPVKTAFSCTQINKYTKSSELLGLLEGLLDTTSE